MWFKALEDMTNRSLYLATTFSLFILALLSWGSQSGGNVKALLALESQAGLARERGWNLSQEQQKDRGQCSPGSYFHLKCQRLHSFLLFTWRAPLLVLLSLGRSAQVMEPSWRYSPKGQCFQRKENPEKKEGEAVCGTGQPQADKDPAENNTHMF